MARAGTVMCREREGGREEKLIVGPRRKRGGIAYSDSGREIWRGSAFCSSNDGRGLGVGEREEEEAKVTVLRR